MGCVKTSKLNAEGCPLADGPCALLLAPGISAKKMRVTRRGSSSPNYLRDKSLDATVLLLLFRFKEEMKEIWVPHWMDLQTTGNAFCATH